jgi:hypothetical protein
MKRFVMYAKTVIVVFVLFGVVVPKSAYAYIDPGSGSYMLQLIIGALLGALFALRLFFKDKIKMFLRTVLSKKNKHEKTEE